MVALILLAGLSLVSTVTGDDSSTSVSTATTFFSCLSLKASPTYGLDDTVSFAWNQSNCFVAGYFCHSYREGLGYDQTASWIQSNWETVTNGITMYDVSALGRTLSAANFTGWPATCAFGMMMPISSEVELRIGGGTFFVQPTSTISTLQTTSLYITTTAGPTIPPVPTTSFTSTPVANHGLSTGAKAGIAIGAIAGIGLIAGAVYWIKTMQQKLKAQHARLTRMEEVNDPGKAAFPIVNPIYGTNPSSPGAGGMMQHGSHASDAVVGLSPVSPKQEHEHGLHELPEK